MSNITLRNPFGRRDPRYFLLFALVLGWIGLSHTTYSGLLIGMLAAMISYSFLFAAFQGSMALIGRDTESMDSSISTPP